MDAAVIGTLGVLAECIALLRDGRDVSAQATGQGRAKRASELAAMSEFLDASSEALHETEYLAMLGKISSSSQQQALLASGAALAFEQFGSKLGPAGARPMGWTMLAFSLGGELIAQQAMRRDARGVFNVVQKLSVTSHQVRRTGNPNAFEAAASMLSAIEVAIHALPGVTPPATAIFRRTDAQEKQAAFRQAMQSAWSVHLALMAPTVTRHGWRRQAIITYTLM